MSDYVTEVEARFDQEGHIAVRRFAWQRRLYVVTGQGRQWVAADGRHLLLMTTGERVFEIVYAEETGLWRVVRAPEERGVA